MRSLSLIPHFALIARIPHTLLWGSIPSSAGSHELSSSFIGKEQHKDKSYRRIAVLLNLTAELWRARWQVEWDSEEGRE